jgi:hypothetical protein
VDGETRGDRLRETIAVVILSIAAVLTAWSGFQSGQWGGEMSIAFSRASAARIEQSRHEADADAARQADLTIWALYVEAQARADETLAAYVRQRFTPHFETAFEAWVASGRVANGPFAMPAYVPPGAEEAAAAGRRADALFAQGLVNNVRGDRYTLLTVIFAIAMFFAAIAGRLGRTGGRWFLTGLGGLMVLGGAAVLVSFPVEV